MRGLGSTFTAINSIANNSGSFTLRNDRNFTTAGALTNSGTVHVDGTAVLATNGNLTLTGDTAALQFDMNALPPGTSYDFIAVNGIATLDGMLRLVVTNGLATTLNGSETFTLLTANAPISGAFDNVANGAGVAAANGVGSFQVHYGPGSAFGAANLVLSNYVPVPAGLQLVSFTVAPGDGGHPSERKTDAVFKGGPGVTYVLEVSTSLQNWTVEQSGTAAPVTGLLTFEFFKPVTAPRFFCRGRLP